MQSLSSLVYSPLKEDETDTTGWNKDTINFALNNKTIVLKYIHSAAKAFGKALTRVETDEIYQKLLVYLYTVSDYDVNKALSKQSGNIISLSSYVGSCAKYCVVRELTRSFEAISKQADIVVKNDDGNETSLLDAIEDEKTRIKDIMDIDEFTSLCKMYEYYRYFQNIDIFQLWTIKLLCLKYEKDNDFYESMIELFMTRKDTMIRFQENRKYYDIMYNIASAVSALGEDKALKVLKNFTYGYDSIERAICMA